MRGDEIRLYTELMDQRAEAEPQSLHAHQIDFFLKQPARIVFAEAGRLHHRLGFVGVSIGSQRRLRLRKHQVLKRASEITPGRAHSPAAKPLKVFGTIYCSISRRPFAISKRRTRERNDMPSRFAPSESS